ncbi:MAG: PQQ-binding-like beta-propeller repeat protein, partial [Nostocoides sp.]
WIGQILLDGANGDELRWGSHADATIGYGGHILAMPTKEVGNGLFALDPKTKNIVWWAPVAGDGSFLTSSGILYHWEGNILYATDPTSGRDLWAHTYPDGYLRDLASNGKQLIGVKSVNTGGPLEVLTSFDPQSGEPTWTLDLSNGRSSFVTVDADRAYLIRSLTAKDDRTLVGVGLDGRQQWATPLPKPDVLYDTRITQANGILYVPLYGALNTYDAATGALLDTLPLRDPAGDKVVPGTAIVDDGHVYLTTTTGVYDLTLP